MTEDRLYKDGSDISRVRDCFEQQVELEDSLVDDFGLWCRGRKIEQVPVRERNGVDAALPCSAPPANLSSLCPELYRDLTYHNRSAVLVVDQLGGSQATRAYTQILILRDSHLP